ncbi:zinc-binding dehydrogenase [Mycobacteroides abscessus]|nr:zinc-binding dehydrogenase [Mycobacteroides abscessus]MDM2428124.1 zinc-binding dehydrogenase [Mycobacteroides abscessus]MDM2433145.1 zinc-binding dehydrogenase [Mycobacteroides abscessus]MDM2438168.1 zinc-binding dehydrogenase [Mycobacteroides abscessus]
MKAAVITQGAVVIQDVERPQPAPTEVLVRVHAAGLSRDDFVSAQREESLRTSAASGEQLTALGHEFSGEVAEVGAQVRNIAIGDRVMGLGFGVQAEYTVADAGCLYHIPKDMDYLHAASLPLALFTAYHSLLLAGSLSRHDLVLVHGASSSIGLMTLQVARLIGAALVIGTSTTESRRRKLHVYGADAAVDSSAPNWPSAVWSATGGRGINLVIDHVAGPNFNQTMETASSGARIVNAGRLGGRRGNFDFDLHARKRLEYIGTTFGTRSLDDYRAASGGIRAVLWPAVENRRLRIPVDQTFSLTEAPEAYRYMGQNNHFGKILIAPNP